MWSPNKPRPDSKSRLPDPVKRGFFRKCRQAALAEFIPIEKWNPSDE
jgi:hypothetical protein